MAGLLMFSTGMDSFILKKLYKFTDEDCLFVNMNTIENKKEEEFINKYFPKVKQITFDLSSFELDNKIIPFRNNILSLIGAQYSSDIFFAFTIGDTTKDKDWVFKSQMEGILNYFATSPEKVKHNAPYTIHMPFKHFTKSELIAKYLNVFEKENFYDLFTYSISCYNGLDNGCGKCRSCLRKYIAFKNNNIETDSYFVKNPKQFLSSFLEESKQKKRNINEIKEIENVLF